MMAKEPVLAEMHDLLVKLAEESHTAVVVVAATQLEAALEEMIASRMPKLTENLRAKFFETGMLSSMRNKIDVAYAMGDISEDVRHDLVVLNKLRNKFAHPRGGKVHFRTPDVLAVMREFKRFDKDRDPYAYFLEKVDELWGGMSRVMEALGYIAALKKLGKEKGSSK